MDVNIANHQLYVFLVVDLSVKYRNTMRAPHCPSEGSSAALPPLVAYLSKRRTQQISGALCRIYHLYRQVSAPWPESGLSQRLRSRSIRLAPKCFHPSSQAHQNCYHTLRSIRCIACDVDFLTKNRIPIKRQSKRKVCTRLFLLLTGVYAAIDGYEHCRIPLQLTV